MRHRVDSVSESAPTRIPAATIAGLGDTLTPRELEVILLYARTLNDKKVARELRDRCADSSQSSRCNCPQARGAESHRTGRRTFLREQFISASSEH